MEETQETFLQHILFLLILPPQDEEVTVRFFFSSILVREQISHKGEKYPASFTVGDILMY